MSTNHWHIVMDCKTPGCKSVVEWADVGEAKDTVSMNKILENIEVPTPCLLTCPVCKVRNEYTHNDLRWLEEPTVLLG
jgi:hypothetical protein